MKPHKQTQWISSVLMILLLSLSFIPVTAFQDTSHDIPPTAFAQAIPEQVEIGEAVTFIGSGVSHVDFDPELAYEWDFGDGQDSDDMIAMHMYAAPSTYYARLTVTDALGNFATDTVTIDVKSRNLPPVVATSAEPNPALVDQSIIFVASAQDLDPDGSVTVKWDFGDGSGEVFRSTAEHSYSEAGQYNAVATAIDNRGGFVTSAVIITVEDPQANNPPTALADADQRLILPGQIVSFTGSGSDPDGDAISYQWKFGDGKQSNEKNPTHQYNDAGQYTAVLKVTDEHGAFVTDAVTITVESTSTGISVFASSDSKGDVGVNQAVQFHANAAPAENIGAFMWNFGDGGSSTEAHPQHSYAATGAYIAVVTATGKDGAMATDSVHITVSEGIPPSVILDGPKEAAVNQPVTFIAHAADSDGKIAFYEWDFNDGTTVKTDGNVFVHTYKKQGPFIPRVIATDNSGHFASASSPITITSGSDVPYPTVVTAIGINTVGKLPLTTSFTAVTNKPDEVFEYKWEFGDGLIDFGQQQVHTYGIQGDLVARVTVRDKDGLTASDVVHIQVLPGDSGTVPGSPVAVITTDKTEGEAPLTVKFSGGDSFDDDGEIMSYRWDFGDEVIGFGKKLNHTYSEEGEYIASLTVTDDLDLTDTTEVTIHVVREGEGPGVLKAVAFATPIKGLVPLTVQFSSDQSQGDIVSYKWSFGDGDMTTLSNPVHTYTELGTYTAKLTVYDTKGQSVSDQVVIEVLDHLGPEERPVAVAHAEPDFGKPPLTVQFSSAGSFDPDGKIVSYLWNFGDGDSVNSRFPEHTYTAVGTFTVTLTVTDNDGHKDIDTVVVTISDSPKVNSPPGMTPISDQVAYVNETFVLSVIATDIDQDKLFFSMSGAPDTLSIDPLTGLILGMPTELGAYIVVVTVTDSKGAADSEAFVLKVTNKPEEVPRSETAEPQVGVQRVHFLPGEYLTLQDVLATSVIVNNQNERNLKDVKVAVSIPELGIKQISGPFDVDSRNEDLRRVVLELPSYTPTGDLTVRVVISNDIFHSVRHRVITVV